MSDYTFRYASENDIPTLCAFRTKLFETLPGFVDFEGREAQEVEILTESMADGVLVAWVAVDAQGTTVATSAISFYQLTPKPWHMSGVYAYVNSMWTEPEHRRKGLGRTLLQHALAHAREVGTPVVTLHAAEAGMPLYASMGFSTTNEMKLSLEEQDAPEGLL